MKNEYESWLEHANDQELIKELQEMADSPEQMEDAFYKELEFGTGGLRGVIGAGTNRMNIHTVAKASQGLAAYICKNYAEEKRSIAVSYDSRIKSDIFAHCSAKIFAANGIRVYIYKELMPTPCLSFAVRELHCAAGIMITASHNPAKYNGYKVYGEDGCQITTEAAEKIFKEIQGVDMFSSGKQKSFEKGLEDDMISYIEETVTERFLSKVKGESLLGNDKVDKDVSIVYTPLNGTGLKPVLRVLKESGYTNIYVVPEQEKPDGKFPTCPYPNPEIREAMSLGIEYARKRNADLLLATDPDCDRVGIAVKKENGEYVLLSGNETGMLLMDYICSRRIALGKMPAHPTVVKTIVTTDMAEKIADDYGVHVINVLTGFKYIGEQIGRLEERGQAEDYIFGFEESYGYLSGTYVRDKDAVNGAYLICEMFAFYKTRGIGLFEKLQELYHKYGYCKNVLYSYEFEGASGFDKMKELMHQFRRGFDMVLDEPVKETLDYLQGIDGLPKSDVIKYKLENGNSVVVRPSGTEPKLKLYISVFGNDEQQAEENAERIHLFFEDIILKK